MRPLFFALGQSSDLGARIAGRVGLSLSLHEERDFTDGEHKTRPLVDVFGQRVYVVHSLYGDSSQSVNDKLCRLLFFIGALRDAGAAFITAVVPYMPYARKDRRTKENDPVTTRYVASLFASVGVNSVVTLAVHNVAAQENAYQCLYHDLDAAPLFADYFARRLDKKAITVLAPDTGAVKNAQRFQQQLGNRGINAGLALMTKTRSGSTVTSSPLFGKLEESCVVVYDDLISSGTTVANAIQQCNEAEDVFVAAAHGSFTKEAERLMEFDCLREVVTSNSVNSDRIDPQRWSKRLQTVDCSALFGDFIQRTTAS